MKEPKLAGYKASPFAQQVSTKDLTVGSDSWKGSLQCFHGSISSEGVLHPRWNLRPCYNQTSTTFNLTSGTAFTRSFTIRGTAPSDTRDPDFPGMVLIKPSYIERYEGMGTPAPLTPLYEEAEGVLSGIPLVDASPSLAIFLDPSLGGSLLLGSLSERSFVWLVYSGDTDVPNLNDSGELTYSSWVESFRIATTTAQAYHTFSDTGTVGALPAFLTDAFSHGKAILLGAINPVGGAILEDSFQLIPEYYYPATHESWPYPSIRSEGGLKDTSFRGTLDTQDLVLGTLPSRFVENRYYNQGAAGDSTKRFFGDFCRETNLIMVAAPTEDYTGTIGDNILTQATDPLNGPYTGLKHFPYGILSVTGSVGDYTSYASIIPMKKYVSFGDASGVPLNQTFTITYGWMNVCEPYLDQSSTPDKVLVNQPLEMESVVVGTTTLTTLPQIVKSVLAPTHFPGQWVVSASKYEGLLTVSPKHLITPNTVGSLGDTTVYPNAQPISPTALAVFLTNDSGTPPSSSVVVTIYGVLDTGEDNYLSPEVVTVNSSSRVEIREGLSVEVPTWAARFEISTHTYRYIRKLVFSGSGSSYCCVVSMENVNPWYELPICSFVFDASGNYIQPTFLDLRRKSLFLSGTTKNNDIGSIMDADGTIYVDVTAGETLAKGALVYIDHTDGFAYNALAENMAVANDDLGKVQVLGVVYPHPIVQGTMGTVLCRGLFGFGTDDPMHSVYANLTPGVVVLSTGTPGDPMNLMDLIEHIKYGDNPYIPVVRVIESFGEK